MKFDLKKYKYRMKTDSDIIFRLDRDYIIREIYTINEDSLLMSRDMIIDRSLQDIIPAELMNQFSGTLEQLSEVDHWGSSSVSYDLLVHGQLKHFTCQLFKDVDDYGCSFFIAIVTEDYRQITTELFEMNLDMMCIVDRNGRIIQVNSLWEKVLGYKGQDLHGVSIMDLVHPSDRDTTSLAFQQLLNAGNIYGVINRYRAKNGEWRWLDWNASVKNNLVYGIARDINDQIKLEEKLKLGEINFRNFFDTLDDMVLITSPEGQIIYANSTLINRLGYSLRELNSKHVLSLHPPELRNEAEAIFREMLTGNRTHCPLPAQTKEGRIIPADTKVWSGHWNGIPCIFALIKDMTRQIESKEAMDRLNAIQSMLMELATKFINLPLSRVDSGIKTSLSMMGEFVRADRVYIFDYDFKRKLTSNTFEWCAAGIEPQIDQLQKIPLETIDVWLDNHLQGKEILIERINEYHDDDATKEILLAQGIKSLLTVPMMRHDECLGFIGFDSVNEYRIYSEDEIKLLKLYSQMLVNIRSREGQESSLKDSLAEKTLLMKEIHHRVKNNLQIISSLLYIQSHFVKDTETRKALNDSENRIRAMALLHENIYSTDDLVGFNFKNYIESIARQVIAHCQQTQGIELVCSLVDVCLEPERAILCGLILNELLMNAIQHAFIGRDQGMINIKLVQDEASIISLTVSDDGIGLTMDSINTKKTSVGIQLIGSLVKQLKGTVQYVSYPDQGTNIIITFSNQRSDLHA